MCREKHNYLKAHRKTTGLTQKELANLLGCNHQMKVSRYERLTRSPRLDVVFACQIIFDSPPHELFPDVYQKVENKIKLRALKLLGELKRDKKTQKNKRMMHILGAILAKIASGSDNGL